MPYATGTMAASFEALRDQSVEQLLALTPFVASLSDEDWHTPSACSGWEVGDVVAHLAAGTGMWAGLIPALTTGATYDGKSWGLPNPSRHNQVRMESVEHRKQSGDMGLKQELADNAKALLEVIGSLTASDAEKTSPVAWGGRGSVKHTLGTIVGEVVFHRWDMESRVRSEVHLPVDALPLLMGYVAGWRGFGFQKRDLPSPIYYRWRLDEPSVTWDVRVNGNSFEHLRDSSQDPDVVFETDTETYILVGVGRVDLEDSVELGLVKATGPADAISAYKGFFENM